ncbi:transcription factor A, mitochondrial [Toxorhynchites rutilus septentrionalis]|uniref:transcription factor A, mitochondrial n=1 Tax=Toxorhynchites rutilus septentrionalis TaxID=329112 RepID=UPI002478AD6C|nr:transcription factor A, mitochondrial [Toxorhynchites rutilus septentrionalis]
MNTLVRLFQSPRLWITSRPTGLPYQVNSSITTTAYSADQSATNSKLPEKPKRPINAFMRFLQSVRSSLRAQHPSASTPEIARLATAQWQVLDAKAKSKLEDEYKKDQAVWLQKNAKYLSELTDDQKESIRQAQQDKSERKAKRECRMRAKQLGKPKRPQNGFLLFVSEHASKTASKEDNIAQVKSLAQKWAKFTDVEKKPYNSRALDALLKYQNDMRIWEEQMVAENNLDVIRRKHILLPEKKRRGDPSASQ